jgi:Kef-type K+ transport system membrane component KefB
MIFFILQILGAWLAVSLIAAPVLIPLLLRRIAKHDAWVEQSRQPPLKIYRFPEVRETHRPR